MLCSLFLRDVGGGDKADINILVLRGISEDVVSFELVTLGLLEVKAFAIVLGSPYLVRWRPVFIPKRKCSAVGVFFIFETL